MALSMVCIGPLLCVIRRFLPCFWHVFPPPLPLFLTMYRIASFLSYDATMMRLKIIWYVANGFIPAPLLKRLRTALRVFF